LKRLNTDREIAPIVAQFVPVKLDISSPEYQQWRRDHPAQGNTIPKLFVVRADGETLYGKSGSLTGNDLPLMLSRALQNSGRILTAKEAKLLTDSADEFEKLKQTGEMARAIKTLGRVRKIGEPGKIGSYSAVALRVNELALETAYEAKTQLTQLVMDMDGDDTKKLAGVLGFLEIKRELGGLRILKTELATFQKQHTTKANSQLMREAKIIDFAKTANSSSKKTRAIERLETLIQSTTIEAVKSTATSALDELKAEPPKAG
jgi:predicted GTPase